MSASLLLLDDFFDRRLVVGVFVDVSEDISFVDGLPFCQNVPGPPFLLFFRDFEEVDVGFGGSWEGPAESL